ncbi:glycosyltransferase family 39 protein [Candidatus Woesearchaeota archaeon]|nr:glycosyltransferase family 39 protein [Candidatus Woesearchaeota archaeon]
MGKLISEGKTPYKDFFYAHPPLHIYLIALFYWIFGFNIMILKSIPLISTLVSSFFIFKITKEKFGNAEALMASLLFLFSYSVMFNSVFSFGIEVAAMFLVIGLHFLYNKGNYALSGLFFGLAGATRLLSLIPIFIIFVFALLSGKKSFLRLSSAFLIIFLLANGIFALFFGSGYFEPVYKYHLIKGFGGRENFREYIDIVKLNWILFSSAILAFFVKDKKPINMLVIVSLAYLAFLMALKKIFGFYFLIIFPFLAIIGGSGIIGIFKMPNIPKKFLALISITMAVAFGWNLASDVLFLEKIGFTGFERGMDLTALVMFNSDKSTMLFGDESIAPLLALLTNRRIALDFVDTNAQVFASGIRDLSVVLADLKGKDMLFIARSAQGIYYFGEVRGFLDRNCNFLGQFHDKIEGNYIVYKCD